MIGSRPVSNWCRVTCVSDPAAGWRTAPTHAVATRILALWVVVCTQMFRCPEISARFSFQVCIHFEAASVRSQLSEIISQLFRNTRHMNVGDATTFLTFRFSTISNERHFQMSFNFEEALSPSSVPIGDNLSGFRNWLTQFHLI